MPTAGFDEPKTRQELKAQCFALLQQGKYAEAELICEQVLRKQPRHFDAVHLLGVIALETGRAARGVALLRRALGLNPRIAAAHNDLGVGLQALGRYDEALKSYDEAIALQADLADAHNNRGNVLRKLRRSEQALASYDSAIKLRPDYAVAYRNRGIVQRELNRRDEALASYDKAITLKPDFAEAYRNRGLLLRDLDRLEEALDSYDRAIALRPGHAAAHGNRGVVLQDLGRHDEALQSYNKAVALQPDDADENWNQGLCLLLFGHFDRGWRQYEWRKKRGIANRQFRQPLWLGRESISGKTLFLHWEQGFGDTIQFYRYVSLVRARGARVVLSVQDSLRRLIGSAEPEVEIIAESEIPSAFDFHCPLMSLPLAFGTTLETIPAPGSYLAADKERKVRWEARLPPKSKPRIGLVWSGSLFHDIKNRTLALVTLLPLLRDDVEWISLQREVAEADAEALRKDGRIAFFGEELKDFSDTAALLDVMDLVITVDTSVAHLAGAMGKPVWILLPYNADWRWLLHRADSPWYPSARLFRLREIGNWNNLIQEVRTELQSLIETGALT